MWLIAKDMLALAGVHFVTPLWPFAFPLRAVVTAGLAVKYNWWLVTLVADLATVLALWVQYWFFRRVQASEWLSQLDRWPRLRAWADRMRSRMWWLLLGLNATPAPEPVFPLLAAAEAYPLGKFLAIMAVGRLVHIVPLALGGDLIWRWWSSLLAVG